jgi:hypothetical protein
MVIIQHNFMAVYLLGTLWIVFCGISAFFTRRCVFWIGDRMFDWSGPKASLGGVLCVLVGGGMFA